MHFLESELPRLSTDKPSEVAGDAYFHIIPAPLEQTVSYGSGTSRGFKAIIDASQQLETFDGKSNPSDLGIYTYIEPDNQEDINKETYSLTKLTLSKGKFPIVIGGEHSASLAAIEAAVDMGYNIGVVQIDAHCDLRDAYEGRPDSHASVMRRVHELGVPLLQIGTRAYCAEENAYRVANADTISWVDGRDCSTFAHEGIQIPEDFPDLVYFTCDVDGLDPSVFPSTGTPVPGGLGYYQTLDIFESVCKQRKVIALDLMEFSPIDGFPCYDFTAAQLLYHFMGIKQRS